MADKPDLPVPSPTITKTRLFLSFMTWYAIWLLAVLFLYRSALAALPYRDHPILMLGHQLAKDDWQWFWSMLSYNRTRVLLPGDYFAFRPILLGIIALQDIFLRYHLIAQGIVNCMMFAFTATAFTSLAKRYVSTFSAVAFTLLWVTLPAGAAIVMWQHISPYILCPGFFLLALRLIADDNLGLSAKTSWVLAALCIGLACLTHEIGIAASLGTAAIIGISGMRNTRNKRQLTLLFLLPSLAAILINGLDYFFIHPTPTLTGPVDSLSNHTNITDIFYFLGAIGAAAYISPVLHFSQMHDGFPEWDFNTESHLLLSGAAFLILILLIIAAVISWKELRKNTTTSSVAFIPLFFMFFLATLAVCAFRMYTRDVFYMAQATYYYSLFSISLSALAVSIYSYWKGKQNQAVVVILVIFLCFLHAMKLNSFLKSSEHVRSRSYAAISQGRDFFLKDQNVCFNGFIPFSLGFNPLFYDISCSLRPDATPLYIYSESENSTWLAAINYNSKAFTSATNVPNAITETNSYRIYPNIPYRHDIQFTVHKTGQLSIILSTSGGNRIGINIQRNLLSQIYNSQAFYFNSLDKDPLISDITYQIGYGNGQIMFFADGRLIGNFPEFTSDTTLLDLTLSTTESKPLKISNLLISQHTDTTNFSFIPHMHQRINYEKRVREDK